MATCSHTNVPLKDFHTDLTELGNTWTEVIRTSMCVMTKMRQHDTNGNVTFTVYTTTTLTRARALAHTMTSDA